MQPLNMVYVLRPSNSIFSISVELYISLYIYYISVEHIMHKDMCIIMFTTRL